MRERKAREYSQNIKSVKTVAKAMWVQWCHPTPLKKVFAKKKLTYIKDEAEQIRCM